MITTLATLCCRTEELGPFWLIQGSTLPSNFDEVLGVGRLQMALVGKSPVRKAYTILTERRSAL